MRLTITRKIVLGLFLIVMIGVLSMALVYRGLTTLRTAVLKLESIEVPAAAAAYEMEINLLGSAMGVVRYLDRGELEDRRRVEKDQADFERFHAEFTRLAKTREARDFADRIRKLYEVFKRVGDGMMADRDRQVTIFAAVDGDLEGLDYVLDRGQQTTIHRPRPAAFRKVQQLGDLEADLAEVGIWLANYRRTHRDRYKELIWVNEKEFRETLRRFQRNAELTRDERGLAGFVDDQFTKTMTRVRELVSIEDRIREQSRYFASVRREIDDVLDEGIQTIALRDLYLPGREANAAAAAMIRTDLFLTVLFLVAAIGVAVVLTRSIVGPVGRLMSGTEAVSRGDLGYRVDSKSGDEFADLASKFNHMVSRLEATTVSKAALEASEATLSDTVTNLRREIAERERAEEEQTRLEAALRRSQVMAAMGSLVVGVAHEVRNPLFAISSVVDALELRLALFGKQEDYASHLSVLRGGLDRLSRLMQDLLDYGRPRSLDLSPGPIEEVVSRAVQACRPLGERLQVRLAARLKGSTGPVRMDRTRLAQAFQNILENAMQHSPAGGTVAVEVEEVSENTHRWIECAIKDSGPGFQTDDLAKIFVPFFTRRPGGTGLGLAIVQRIVEGHEGTVSVGNHPEGGGVVTLRLPVIQPSFDPRQG